MSGSDFFDSGMKGKGIHPLHLLGDELWLVNELFFLCLFPGLNVILNIV